MRIKMELKTIRKFVQLYRSFDFGKLADVIMLDERLFGRSEPVKNSDDPHLNDSIRTMLGVEQMIWLSDQMKSSTAQWKIIGNQVIFSYLNWGFPSWKVNMDSWDGYPAERKKNKHLIVDNAIENVVL